MDETTNAINECNFCNRHRENVGKLIVSKDVAICNDCVELCQNLLEKENHNHINLVKPPDPVDIKKFLDACVVGQEQAKTVLAVAITNHYKRINRRDDSVEIEKSNILMIGPTGCGKTLLARSIAKYLDVAFIIADSTSLTEAGYVGEDVENIISRLYSAADYDIARCQRGIVFIDEIDKIARKNEGTSTSRDVSGEGVQQALLKIVEGTICRISPPGVRKYSTGEIIEIDTRDILFIAGGTFLGLDNIIKKRHTGISMGFGVDTVDTVKNQSLDAMPDDLIRYGMIPEFVGRFSCCVTLNSLSANELFSILNVVKNNYVQQYQWLFAQDEIDLVFTQDALQTIVSLTCAQLTGARGLRARLEKILLPHMYNIVNYKSSGIDKIIIDHTQVMNPNKLQYANA